MQTKWEYKIIDSTDIEGSGFLKGKSRQDIENFLNGLGSQGWEIVNLDWRDMESRKSFSGVAKRKLG